MAGGPGAGRCWLSPPPQGSSGQGAGGGAGDDLDGVGGVGEGDDLGVFPLVRLAPGEGGSRAEDEHAAAGLGQAGDALLPAGDFPGNVVGVGDDGQQPGGAGAGQAERAVEGVDGAAELLGAVGGVEVGDAGGCLAGVGESVHLLPVQDGGGGRGGQGAGGAGEDPAGGGDRAGEFGHGGGDVAGDADAQRRGGHAAAAGGGGVGRRSRWEKRG